MGQVKSGTASLVGLLGSRYRAAHEPERAELLALIVREARGEVDAEGVRDFLLERDQRLNLEYDVAWANQFILGHLLDVFPEARFIVLVRDPYTWLHSVAGHLLSRPIPVEVRGFLDWWFQPETYPYEPGDAGLAGRGLYSTAAFLSAWDRHVRECTRMIREERRLVVRTHELSTSHQRIADFLRIRIETLDAAHGHLNRGTFSGPFEALVEPSYVDTVVTSICGETMEEFFPEIGDHRDVESLWRP